MSNYVLHVCANTCTAGRTLALDLSPTSRQIGRIRMDVSEMVRCDGCDRMSVVRAFDNGRSYCHRCAEEVQALGWARPEPPRGRV